ncbi:hypothetical protein POJ06DRAFT_112792 [Lipomyces tetrasporus]|uniref:Glucose-methanol-choline oxidoreductase C-terminal domain-containing protein n=1 Tax=Lipomyces tetrasporus TaxID=54092 RepID=A0AAD7QQJ7_9ASCO|nr:uncharacterized protein POJ06DRAFT_112792 [Lipomyces tetrasporus]KAJ8099569.1 hypothetical protein POJ06DRAFT_112792 [Lipomyces tetrasporus]
MKEIIGEDYPCPIPRQSDEAMKRVILERSQTGFHSCGPLRLSKDIKQGVVDPELRVHGAKIIASFMHLSFLLFLIAASRILCT